LVATFFFVYIYHYAGFIFFVITLLRGYKVLKAKKTLLISPSLPSSLGEGKNSIYQIDEMFIERVTSQALKEFFGF
jgi:hypothetical protein